MQVVNGAGGSLTSIPERTVSGDKRARGEGEREAGMEPSPLLFSVREAGTERVLERCGGLNGTS